MLVNSRPVAFTGTAESCDSRNSDRGRAIQAHTKSQQIWTSVSSLSVMVRYGEAFPPGGDEVTVPSLTLTS